MLRRARNRPPKDILDMNPLTSVTGTIVTGFVLAILLAVVL